jgi:hypothetical protein
MWGGWWPASSVVPRAADQKAVPRSRSRRRPRSGPHGCGAPSRVLGVGERGRPVSLSSDPVEVLGVTVVDRPSADAGHLVRVALLGVLHEAASRAGARPTQDRRSRLADDDSALPAPGHEVNRRCWRLLDCLPTGAPVPRWSPTSGTLDHEIRRNAWSEWVELRGFEPLTP